MTTTVALDDFRQSANDTGSPEYQVAIFTKRITHLTTHLKANPKDAHTRRGLTRLVSKRRKALDYLKGKSSDRYQKLIKALGIRR